MSSIWQIRTPIDPPVHALPGAEGITYIRTSELVEGERALYERWLDGQTRPLIPEAPDASYSWDYYTWRNRATKGLPYDWD